MKKKTLIYKILVVACVITFLGCSQTSNIKVTPVSYTSTPKNSGFYYALPKTSISVTIDMTRSVTIKGPYAEYANKLLGIQNVPLADGVEWKISNISLNSIAQSDPNHYYFVEVTDKKLHLSALFKLVEEGLIVDMHQLHPTTALHTQTSIAGGNLLYTDLSSKHFLAEITDTLYKTIFRDTVFVKIPIFRNVMRQRTLEEKAGEAANFIFTLRERRFDLFTGQYDFLPEGQAADATIKELKRLENEYLSLFTGKTITEKVTTTYFVTPNELRPNEPIPICRFSENEGPLTLSSNKGRVLSAKFDKMGKTEVLDSERSENTKSNKNILYYRIPDAATITINYGHDTIHEQQFLISQFGVIVSFPANIQIIRNE